MSIFSSLKRAFGLGDNYDADEQDFEETEETSYSSEETPSSLPEIQINQDESLSGDIFEGVITLFNQIQPEFVRQCIDTEAQKTYILENIQSSLKERLENEVRTARLRGQQLWEEERRRLGEEVETLRHQKETLEQKREESKSQRLSAERQKRALVERVHDLETQLLSAEAEKEQYVLENRSMLNKLRVASVTSGGASDDTIGEIENLNAQLETLRKESEDRRLDSEHFEAVAAAHIPVIENLLETIDELVKELAAKNARMNADALSLSQVQEELKDATETIAKQKRRIDSLRSSQDRDVRQIADFNRLVKEKDAFISTLKAEIDELNRTIALNMEDAARMMEKNGNSSSNDAKSRKSRKKKQKPHISAIDELLDSTDWFVAAPPPPKQKEPEKEDDFGYKAPPQRKSHPDDDKQLSLW